jgi:hypothetical protein
VKDFTSEHRDWEGQKSGSDGLRKLAKGKRIATGEKLRGGWMGCGQSQCRVD